MQPLEDLSKERLINDLLKLRKRIDELEKIKEEKAKYEAELAQTEAMYEGLFQFAPDAILIINNKGSIIRANQQAERLFGYSCEEFIGLEHDVVVPDRFRERHRAERKLYMSAPHVRRMGTGLELYARRKDGTEFPVDISLGPLQVKDEIVALAVVHDITFRKQTEEALRESEERFRALMTASSEALYCMSPDWSEMRQLKSQVFLSGTEKPSRTWLQEYIHPDDQPHVTIVIKEAIRAKSIFDLEHRVLRADGSIGWTHSRAVPLMDKNGEIVEWFGAASDISERKQMEENLQKMVQDRTVELETKSKSLQELNSALKVLLQQRDDDKKVTEERFVINVKNLVLPYVEQMKKGSLDAGQRECLAVIETNLNEITTPLLQNIGQFNLTPKEIKVVALIRQGKSSKEIAEILGIATGSIDVHRRNIRKKLGLTNRRANLLSRLESLG